MNLSGDRHTTTAKVGKELETRPPGHTRQPSANSANAEEPSQHLLAALCNFAAREGLVSCLLSSGGYLNVRNERGQTPLMVVPCDHSYESRKRMIFKRVVELVAEVNATGEDKCPNKASKRERQWLLGATALNVYRP